MAAPHAPFPSPMLAVEPARPTRRSTMPLLLQMSHHLEAQALGQGDLVVVLSAFQTSDRFTPATARRYTELARHSTFVAALGVGMKEEPAPGVRGGHLEPDDPLVDEWSIAVVGPHFSAALAAIDRGDVADDGGRRFDYVLTYDRDLVLDVARSLMTRILPTAGSPAL